MLINKTIMDITIKSPRRVKPFSRTISFSFDLSFCIFLLGAFTVSCELFPAINSWLSPVSNRLKTLSVNGYQLIADCHKSELTWSKFVTPSI